MNRQNQKILNNYFSTKWLQRQPEFGNYKYSGWSLLDEIGEKESVLDVGCGNHYFRDHLTVYGIDPANSRADEIVTIDEFQTQDQYDIALCLGSVNFGTEQDIQNQINKIISLLAPHGRIYWRCNPGRHDHGNSEFELIDVFPWSFDLHKKLAVKNNCLIKELKWDTGNRIYSEWVRND